MTKKWVIFVVLALVLTLSACQRSATKAPLVTPSSAAQTSPTSSDPMAMLRSFATQTALAMSGELPPTQVSSGTTPVPTSNATLSFPLTPIAPTATPMNTAIPANTTRPLTYTLQEGEYPYCIARRFDVNPDDLLSINGLGSGGMYVPGLVLKIPQTGSFPGPRQLISRPDSYTVAAGDTVYKIACKYGDIDPISIATANSLVAPYTLTVGKVIYIP